MIKVLYLPLNVAGNKQVATIDAWKLPNIDLQIFDFYNLFEKNKNKKVVEQEFLNIATSFQPHLIHMQLQMTGVIGPETLMKIRKAVKHKVLITNWSGDFRNNLSQELKSLAHAVDYTLISNTYELPLYEKEGFKNFKYWQIGYDPKLFNPQFKKEFKYDLTFIGNAYPDHTFENSKLRNNILLNLKNALKDRFAVYGNGHRDEVGSLGYASGSAVNDAYNNSLCVLSLSNYLEKNMYFSDRLLTAIASGRPCIQYPFPGFQNYFSENENILHARNVTEIIEKVQQCKENINWANEIGYNGYLCAASYHTYKSRIIELLNMLGLT